MTTVVSPGNGAGSGDLAEATSSDSSLRRFLHGLPGVDQVGAEARTAMLGTRSIKTTAKQFAIDLAIRMVDLTTLEGQDTPGKVRALATKAMRPDPADPTCPSTAAVCVYPDMVATAKEVVGDRGVNIAAVAT
ncbi:MAG: deoxyribose-phosphate aldolase, partial [Nocardioidaceae bacterium]